MLSQEKIEELTMFVQRYCSWVAGSDPAATDLGYFAFYAGRSSRVSRVARAAVRVVSGVPWEQIGALVLSRAKELAGAGEGNAYVRFYEGKSSNFEDQVVVPGVQSDDEVVAGVDDGSAVGSLVGALLITHRHQHVRIVELERRVDERNEQLAVGREQFTLVALASQMWERTAKTQRTAEAMQAFLPIASQALPVILQMVFGGAPSSPGAPPPKPGDAPAQTPEEQIDRLVALIGAAVQELLRVATAHPSAVGERLAPLREIVARILPLFGLGSPGGAASKKRPPKADS